MEEQRKTVTKTFWPKDVLNTNSVIPCSSLMGLSARDLLDKSYRRKPLFEEVWKKEAVGYHVRGSLLTERLALSHHQCAAKILGVGDPQAAYDRFDYQTWKNKLNMELRDSGFPSAIHELTKEMVDCTQIKALLSKTDTITKHLKVLRSVQGCGPLSYSSPSFHLLLADENFLRQGEPRTTTIPLK